MKRFAQTALILLLILAAASCSPKKLVPGDRINEMELLDFCEGTNLIDLCNFKTLVEGNCQVPASVTNLWVSAGWSELNSSDLNAMWETFTWELTFDGHSIDLESFGTYDLDIYDSISGMRKARVWNFCISNPTAGVHVTHWVRSYVYDEREGQEIFDWTFTVLEPGESIP